MNNNYLKLPLNFDKEKLNHDCQVALKTSWIPHFNSNDYSGSWKAIALRALGGQSENVMPLAGNNSEKENTYQFTPLLDKCPYFKSILEDLHYELEAVRLLKLDPGSIIKEHTDRGLGYEAGEFRIHIPIQTNPGVTFFSSGEPFQPQPGECWYLNAGQPHAVENLGKTPRVHLVIDGHQNEWTDELFKKAGYDFESERLKNKFSKKIEIELMIKNFELMGNEIGDRMAKEWKEKLAKGEF